LGRRRRGLVLRFDRFRGSANSQQLTPELFRTAAIPETASTYSRRSCHVLAARPIASSSPAPCRQPLARDQGFADSPLEESGFEPLVPLESQHNRGSGPMSPMRTGAFRYIAGTKSLRTRRWRKADSNRWSHLRQRCRLNWQRGLQVQLGCWRSATSGRCRGCAGSEVGPAVRILLPQAARLQTLGPSSQNGFGRAGNRHQHATAKEVAVLRGHEGPVRFAAFSPDGLRIVTASDDRSVSDAMHS
jgi:hypothetical protein